MVAARRKDCPHEWINSLWCSFCRMRIEAFEMDLYSDDSDDSEDSEDVQGGERYPSLNSEPIRVAHASLEKFNEESAFKAHCPACKTGLLLVARDHRTFRLQRDDRCIGCAQRFVYTDTEIGGEELPLEKPRTSGYERDPVGTEE